MRANTPSGDKASRQQLDRILASATFRQVDRLKRFLKFIVPRGARRARRPAEGIRHRRAGVRQGCHPSIRAPTRSCACRRGGCARGWSRYYREEGGADAVVIELPKGRLRAGVQAARCDVGADAVRSAPRSPAQNTIAVLPFADHSAGARPRVLLPGPPAGDDPSAGEARSAARPDLQPGEPAAHAGADEQPSMPRCCSPAACASPATGCASPSISIDNATGSYLWSESIDASAGRHLRGAGGRRRRHRQEARAEARSMPATGAAAGGRRRISRRATSTCRGAIT